MSKLVAYIKKPADKTEIFSIIKYFNINSLYLIANQNQLRINQDELNSWIKEFCLSGDIQLINIDELNLNDFICIIKKYNSKYVALPIGIHSLFYKSVQKLKRQGKIIIHLSDGTQDCFSLFRANLALRAKNISGFFKAIISYPIYLFSKADFCFFQLYPLQSCYAKKTLPIIKNRSINLENYLLTDSNIDTLLISGWGETVESLKQNLPENQPFIASSKGLEVIINNENFKTKKNITAEDIVDSLKIKYIYSSASTAAIYAKINYPNSYVKVFFNGSLNKFYGKTYEYEYKKIAKRLGILICEK